MLDRKLFVIMYSFKTMVIPIMHNGGIHAWYSIVYPCRGYVKHYLIERILNVSSELREWI